MKGSDQYKEYLVSELRENPKDFREKSQVLECDIEEAMKTGIYVSGTSGIGKSDIAMYISDLMIAEGITVLTVDTSQDWENRSSIPYVQKINGINEIRLDRSTIFDTS